MNYLSDHFCFYCAVVCAVSGDLLCDWMAKPGRTKAVTAARRVKRMKTETLLSQHFPRECSLICRILLRFLATSARKEFNVVSSKRCSLGNNPLWTILLFQLLLLQMEKELEKDCYRKSGMFCFWRLDNCILQISVWPLRHSVLSMGVSKARSTS
jgi:hypothetical protein